MNVTSVHDDSAERKPVRNYASPAVTEEARIERDFTYHAPKDNQPARYNAIRAKAKELALLFNESVPYSRERSLAFTNLEQACFWANAAIARNE